MTFTDNGTALGSVALNGNTASLTTSALAAGSHNLAATYSGDATHASQASLAVTITVNATPVQQPTVGAPTLNAYWLAMLASLFCGLALHTLRRKSAAH